MRSLLYLLVVSIFITSCDEDGVIFSIENDKQLGQQVSEQIAEDPQFDLMSRSEYPEAYAYLDGMVDEILNNGNVTYKDEFVWDVTLVQDDSTLNAFATPGGYIYVYTGLIKYLESADALAGVIGHEIAHADLRHSSRNLQKQYGVAILIGIVTGGDPGALATLASNVLSLSFSRDFEYEADERAVEYNANTIYACDGVKDFFQQLEEDSNGGRQPEFLSTHPSPPNRITEINGRADELNCDTTDSGDQGYEDFKDSLPE